ncbi:MAG: gephyrin-like molybdotransferase Glp [Pseudomonadota bacterium]
MPPTELNVQRDPSCEDDFDDASLSANDARVRILNNVAVISGEHRVPVRDSLRRYLSRDIHSPVNVPQQTNSAMDGYAIAGNDLPSTGTARLDVLGTALAGHPFEGVFRPGGAVRIMTGAPMPEGCDTVLMQEHVEHNGDHITLDHHHKIGQHVRAAGEDLKAGQQVLPAAHLMNPADLGLVASLGIGEVHVHRRLRVAYFSTGDELRSIGEPLGVGQIYDSNRYTLYGMLERINAEIIDMGVVGDSKQAVADAFAAASQMADVVISSGGVSVGEADYIKGVLADLGQVGFWKVAMKPGRPLAFGLLGDAAFFGLPGNPVSVMVTFYQFVQPALTKMAGGVVRQWLTCEATVTETLKKRPGRVEFQRAAMSRDHRGRLLVTPTGDQGSGILRSMSSADCLIVLPIDSAGVDAGSVVEIQPFSDFM